MTVELSICSYICFFFFKQKTAYEMRISDWSSDVCSSDLPFEQNFRGFRIERVRNAAVVHRAHRRALRFVEVADALGAAVVGNDVDVVAFALPLTHMVDRKSVV